MCVFHKCVSSSLPSLLVMASSLVNRDSAKLVVVSTVVREGRRVAFLIHWEPCGEVFKWRVLRDPSCMGGDTVPQNLVSSNG